MVRPCLRTAIAWVLLLLAAADAGVAPTPASSALNCKDSPNVVQNGGFESGTLAPWSKFLRPVPGQANSTLTIVNGGYNNSAHALRMEVGYTAQIRQDNIPTCESTVYTVSFAYKVLRATASCVIKTTANSSTTNVYQSTISPLLRSNWRIGRLKFHSEIAIPYELRIALICQYEGSAATVLLDDIQVRATGSVAAQGCPKPVTLPNGNFDDGQLAPWEAGGGGENAPQVSIVSPGYKSQYALQLEFAASSFTESDVAVPINDTCEGYEYNVTFALNWLKYTGPENGPFGCNVSIGISDCFPTTPGADVFPASRTPGWKQHSVVFLADGNNGALLDVEMWCVAKKNTTIPSFTVQVDQVGFSLLPTPYPKPSSKVARAMAMTAL